MRKNRHLLSLFIILIFTFTTCGISTISYAKSGGSSSSSSKSSSSSSSSKSSSKSSSGSSSKNSSSGFKSGNYSSSDKKSSTTNSTDKKSSSSSGYSSGNYSSKSDSNSTSSDFKSGSYNSSKSNSNSSSRDSKQSSGTTKSSSSGSYGKSSNNSSSKSTYKPSKPIDDNSWVFKKYNVTPIYRDKSTSSDYYYYNTGSYTNGILSHYWLYRYLTPQHRVYIDTNGYVREAPSYTGIGSVLWDVFTVLVFIGIIIFLVKLFRKKKR